jgi:outer membrane protein
MRQLLSIAILLLVSIRPAACLAQDADLTVRLGVAPRRGGVVVMLFDSAEGFEDFRAPARVETFAAGDPAALVLRDVPVGTYALVVFNDENGNRRLDVNFIGIPKEPIGFANAYRPKGPPGFERAAFRVEEGTNAVVDVGLARPLGNRGRLGLGVGVLARGSPYVESSGNPVLFIPAVTYIGNRLQVYGPFAQCGITGSGGTRLAATLAYRMAVYEEDDSPALEGMADRKATAMAGLRLQRNAPGGIHLQAGYAHDMLDRIGGGQAQAGLSRPVPWRSLRVTPSLSANWISAALVRHDFGVAPEEATPDRPAYRPGDSFSLEAGLSVFAEITPSVFGALSAGIEWFGDDIRHSPIVDDDRVLKGYAFITYML